MSGICNSLYLRLAQYRLRINNLTAQQCADSHDKSNLYVVWEISKLLGHSSAQETLCYIGITKQKIGQMYEGLFNDVEL